MGHLPDAPPVARLHYRVMSSIESSETFQIPLEAAEAYEEAFVPAFFAQWAPVLCDAAGVTAGQNVLDVACGTGIVARTAADLVGAPNVVGVDLNEAMLTVARRVRPDIDWRQGDAGALPLPDLAFDAVLCQMALMFFPERATALRETGRVATAGGTVAVLVPSALDVQPAYGPLVDMAARHAGGHALAAQHLLRLRRPRRASQPVRIHRAAGDGHTRAFRQGQVSVRRCARGHGGREHPAAGAHQRRRL